jgi:hypothetical protein
MRPERDRDSLVNDAAMRAAVKRGDVARLNKLLDKLAKEKAKERERRPRQRN